MVTVADRVSGPLIIKAVSPVPGVDCQPSGTVMVIRGAAGSDTVATVGSPSPVGVTTQAGMSGAMRCRCVGTIPGTGSAGSECWSAAADPLVFESQPTSAPDRYATPAAASAARRQDRSIARKGKR